MHEVTDAGFETRLRRALHDETAALPDDAWMETVRARLRGIESGRRGRRSWTLAAVVAAALLLPIGLWATGAAPVLPAPERSGWEAVIARKDTTGEAPTVFTILAVDTAGAERRVGMIPRAAFTEWYWLDHTGDLAVSPDGWLALQSGGKAEWYTFLVDLPDPTAELRRLPFASVAWDPAGRVWSPYPSGSPMISGSMAPLRQLTVLDPRTGSSIDVSADEVPAEIRDDPNIGPFTADGTAVVLSDAATRRVVGEDGRPVPARIVVLGDDGRVRVSSLAQHLVTLDRSGPRWLGVDKSRLVICPTGSEEGRTSCQFLAEGGVASVWRDGRIMTWWRNNRDGVAVDASFDAADHGVWVLLDRASGSEPGFELAHLEALDASASGEGIVMEARIRLPGESWAYARLSMAPDDSVIAVHQPRGDSGDGPIAILDPVAGSVSLQHGRFAGFVPAASMGTSD